MIKISDSAFETLISEVMDELPQEYIFNMKNVVVTYADLPTNEQRQKHNLQKNQTLYGLYEGIPLTQRGAGYSMVLPDKITIFKEPISRASHSESELREQVKHTLWHEIAHHYGLDHSRIAEIEAHWK